MRKYKEVLLTLTGDQAETLRLICSRIGGHPDFTRRAHMDAISKQLDVAGVALKDFAVDDKFSRIYFTREDA